MNSSVQQIGSLAAFLVAGITAVCWHTDTRAAGSRDRKAMATYADQPGTKSVSSWDQKAAAAYLDQRQSWWMEWPKAARDHDTFCVSCHTAVPYALSRPALRKANGACSASAFLQVPFSSALRAFAACSSKGTCRTSSVGERTPAPGQCQEACKALEGNRAVLQRRGSRRVQDGRVSRNGICSQRADSCQQ